jgi:uncharacterized membrane protein YoaK (UPF0700 family)
MVFPAAACGVVNSIGAAKSGVVTSMITGHIMTVAGKIGDGLVDMLSSVQPSTATRQSRWRSALQSLGMIASLASGAVVGTVAWEATGLPGRDALWVLPSSESPWRFTFFGCIYAATLILCDTPAPGFWSTTKAIKAA